MIIHLQIPATNCWTCWPNSPILKVTFLPIPIAPNPCTGMFYRYLSPDLQTIDFEVFPMFPDCCAIPKGFTSFINCYFGAELPADLIQQLFLSFCNSASPAEPQRRPSAIEEAVKSVKNVFHGRKESTAPRKESTAVRKESVMPNRKVSTFGGGGPSNVKSQNGIGKEHTMVGTFRGKTIH